jgi:hypothetical protein
MAIHPPPKADAFEEGVFSPSTINIFQQFFRQFERAYDKRRIKKIYMGVDVPIVRSSYI